MRTKAEIERQIKYTKSQLSEEIDSALEAEKNYEKETEQLNQELANLNKEIPYENTLAGQTDQLLKEVRGNIKKLLIDFEQKTGVEISFDFHTKKDSLIGESVRRNWIPEKNASHIAFKGDAADAFNYSILGSFKTSPRSKYANAECQNCRAYHFYQTHAFKAPKGGF